MLFFFSITQYQNRIASVYLSVYPDTEVKKRPKEQKLLISWPKNSCLKTLYLLYVSGDLPTFLKWILIRNISIPETLQFLRISLFKILSFDFIPNI